MWVNSTTVVVVGAGVAERHRVIWGGSVLVVERIRRMSLPDWSAWIVGWHRIFFHVAVGGMLERLMFRWSELVEWGACGVQ